MADYITFTLSDKIDMLGQLERRRMLGAVKSQGSGDRVATEFTGTTEHLLNEIEKLKDAIRCDPGFNNTNPLWAALMADRRRQITRVSFGGAYGNQGHYGY